MNHPLTVADMDETFAGAILEIPDTAHHDVITRLPFAAAYPAGTALTTVVTRHDHGLVFPNTAPVTIIKSPKFADISAARDFKKTIQRVQDSHQAQTDPREEAETDPIFIGETLYEIAAEYARAFHPEPKADHSQTDYTVAPGEYLREWMDDCCVTRPSAAWLLGLSPDQLEDLLTGAMPIDEQLAQTLETRTTMAAASWLRFEKAYLQDLQRLGLDRPKTRFSA